MAITFRNFMPRKGILASWEKTRNTPEVHWAMECFAEMLGVCMYVYFGVGSTAGFVIQGINKVSGLSSIFQIGFAYSLGIIFAVAVCASTSGGHFNPCVTLAFCIFKKFPVLKGMRYIVAQIFGAYIACFLVYGQWKVLIHHAEDVLMARGADVFAATQFTPDGPPGIFAFYLLPGQDFSRAFMNEFVNCTFIALIIWAAFDPTNYMVPPVMAPFLISFSYGNVIWGFALPGISLNTARDVGGRLMAISVWGLEAGGGGYAIITALANIPATLLAACIYEFLLMDSDRAIAGWHMDFINHNMNHGRLQQYADDVAKSDLSIDHKGIISQTEITRECDHFNRSHA